MKNLLLIIFLFLFAKGISQEDYIDCTITFANDSIKKGKCTMPKFPSDNGIFFKKGNSKRIYIDGDQVSRLEITRKENKHTFDFLPVAVYKKKQDSIVVEKRNYWLYLKFATEHMSTYVKSNSYSINWRGNVQLKSTNLAGNHPIVFYLKKEKDNYAFYTIDFTEGWSDDRSFYRNLFHYFKDDPKIYQIINKKQIKWDRINEIPVYYSLYINQKI